MSAAAIELENATLGSNRRVVSRRLSLRVDQGEFVGLFGANGAGKTTLIRSLLGLLEPLEGQVRVLETTPRRARRWIGYLPQGDPDVAHVHLSAREFIGSALRGNRWGVPWLSRSDQLEIGRALELADAAAFADRPVSELSGGERQRVLLAQALVGEPRLLLLDEPLAGLDPRFQHQVVALVRDLQRSLGITVVFAAHDVNPLLGVMTCAVCLFDVGALAGRPEAVITDTILSRLYHMPMSVVRRDEHVRVIAARPVAAASGSAHA